MKLSTASKAGWVASDNLGVNPNLPVAIPIGLSVALAGTASLWLRQLDARADAGNIVFWLLPWSVAALLVLRTRAPSWAVMVAAAVAMRVMFVGAPPWLSDDVYRYLAEGHALNHGENPFLVAPIAMQSISEGLRAQVNHAELTTLYPPIAHAWFRLLDVLGGSVGTAQWMTTVADVSLVVAIARSAGTRWGLLYALHPLGPLEAALGAHIDVVAVALMAWAVVFARERPGPAAFLLMLGAGVKLFPVVVLPSLFLRRARRSVLIGTLIGCGVCLIAALPVLGAGPALVQTLGTYSSSWSFNGLGLALIEPLSPLPPRWVLASVGAVAFVLATWKARDERVVWGIVGAAFLCITPTAHPWYALWAVVPALLLGRASWLLASTALLGSYAVLWSLASPGGWTEPTWLLPATWGPALVIVGVATWMQWRARPTP